MWCWKLLQHWKTKISSEWLEMPSQLGSCESLLIHQPRDVDIHPRPPGPSPVNSRMLISDTLSSPEVSASSPRHPGRHSSAQP